MSTCAGCHFRELETEITIPLWMFYFTFLHKLFLTYFRVMSYMLSIIHHPWKEASRGMMEWSYCNSLTTEASAGEAKEEML